MVKLSKKAQQRVQKLFKGSQFAICWDFISLMIYLEFKRSADSETPGSTILSLLWR
ncbi:mitochondrial import receptor subunit TOM7 homolog [Molossus molossus]|uniref:mitochondrial import receptor subunit TOM7 homolog n=1 Tax=Molossus molossus TaxID=27622 RepID=UPI00174647F1|nr:mitochondrial import receptor subunit TOM7 homolog [Molossus molossus]